jgi:hypothetical protein
MLISNKPDLNKARDNAIDFSSNMAPVIVWLFVIMVSQSM